MQAGVEKLNRWASKGLLDYANASSGLSQSFLERPLNLAAMFFPLRRKKHKIGNTSTHLWVPRSNVLTQEKETFNIYELNSHQRHFDIDEFQSSYAN